MGVFFYFNTFVFHSCFGALTREPTPTPPERIRDKLSQERKFVLFCFKTLIIRSCLMPLRRLMVTRSWSGMPKGTLGTRIIGVKKQKRRHFPKVTLGQAESLKRF